MVTALLIVCFNFDTDGSKCLYTAENDKHLNCIQASCFCTVEFELGVEST